MNDTPDILRRILARKTEEIIERSRRLPANELRRQVESAPSPRGFLQAIHARLASGKPAIIAEIKRASPSQGLLRADFRPADIARSYEHHGATCLSVLTDVDFFQGCDAHLQEARTACRLPVLRKDFTIKEYQVYEARFLGADAVLLIAAALADNQMHDLAELVGELGMDVLVEIHEERELDRALRLPVPLIGINNRDLRTFHTTLDTTLGLLKKIPVDRIVITESGIHTPEDVESLRAQGINAFLVGEAFMRAENPGIKLQEMFDSPLNVSERKQ